VARFSFYNSARWHKLSKLCIERAGGLCEECGGTICDGKANIAHHIVEVNDSNIDDPMIVWSLENLKAVSRDCHNRIHHGCSDNSVCIDGYGFDENGFLTRPSKISV
jgi:5-methylcytosine-specific restriction endonuclease McrA